MKTSKELLVVAKIVPKLRLGTKYLNDAGKQAVKSTGAHRVRLLEDKIVRAMDRQTNKEVEFVEYIIEEKGEKKVYRTKLKDKNGKLSYLVQRLAEFEEGEEVILEMRKSGLINYVDVSPVGNTSTVEVEDDDHEEDGVIE